MLFYGYAVKRKESQSFLKHLYEHHDGGLYDHHVEIGMCGSDHEPHYVVLIKASKKLSEGDGTMPIPNIDTRPTWNRMLKTYLHNIEADFPREHAGWWLVSYADGG